MTWLILGNTFASVLGEVIKSWLESESITSTRTMHCRNPTPLGLEAVTGKVDMELAGPVSTEPLEPRRVTELAGCAGSHVGCGRPVVQHQHSGCLQVLFMSSRLVFSVLSIEDACGCCSCPAGWCSAFRMPAGCCLCPCSSGPRTMTRWSSRTELWNQWLYTFWH